MRLPRPLLVVGLVAWISPSASRAEEPASAELTVTVATEVVPAPKPTDPPPAKNGEPRVAVPPITVELEDGVATGVPAPAEGRAWKGTLELGDRKLPVGVVCASGKPCELYLDADRDGTLDPAKERVEAPVSPAGDSGASARFEHVRFGGSEVVVTVQRRSASFGGMVADPPVPGQKSSPATPLVFTTTPPGDTAKLAAYPGTARFATATIRSDTMHVAAIRDGADGLVLLLGKAADFSDAGPVKVTAFPLTRGARVFGTRWNSEPTYPPATKNRFIFSCQETVDNAWAIVTPAATRRGGADVEGKPHVLYLLDGDFDGAYCGADDAWWFGPKGTRPNPNLNNMTEGDAPGLLEGGLVWTLKDVAADGKATLVRSHKPDAADEVLHRRAERVNAKRWFPRFAQDREFDKARPPDPTRKRAATPFRFHFALTLDDAFALAAKEGKPLLVDFEADWCVWCKRLDYHTYPDAGVVEALGRFTCVKINNELDPKKSFNALGWRGIPAVGVFGPDRKPVVFQMPPREGRDAPVVDHIPGFLMPKDFVAALDATLAALDDVKHGKAPLVLPAPKGPEAPRPPAPPAAPPVPDQPTEKPTEKPTAAPAEQPAAPPAPAPQGPQQPEPAPTK